MKCQACREVEANVTIEGQFEVCMTCSEQIHSKVVHKLQEDISFLVFMKIKNQMSRQANEDDYI